MDIKAGYTPDLHGSIFTFTLGYTYKFISAGFGYGLFSASDYKDYEASLDPDASIDGIYLSIGFKY